MSIKLMSAAWDLDIPATEKMVLLCLCDYANAEGTCWPGAEGIGKRCSLTERTVRKAIKWLMDEGLLGAQIRPGKTAVYKIDPGSKFTPEANSPRNMTAQPRKEIPDTPEAASDEPSRTIKEPSVYELPARDGVEIPEWIPICRFDAWLAMRRAIKEPPTREAIKLAVGKLEKMKAKGHDPGEVLDQSTLNNWKGLFEVRENGRSNQNIRAGNIAGFDRRSSLARAIDEGIEFLQ